MNTLPPTQTLQSLFSAFSIFRTATAINASITQHIGNNIIYIKYTQPIKKKKRASFRFLILLLFRNLFLCHHSIYPCTVLYTTTEKILYTEDHLFFLIPTLCPVETYSLLHCNSGISKREKKIGPPVFISMICTYSVRLKFFFPPPRFLATAS